MFRAAMPARRRSPIWRRLRARSGLLEPFVGLMTAASLEHARVVVERDDAITVVAVVTVGLGNPIAAGVTEAFETHAWHN